LTKVGSRSAHLPRKKSLSSFGNAENQRNAIAISDLQVKVAQLRRGRAELAQKIREQV